MVVEDSSDDDGFRSVERKKRKKPGDAGADAEGGNLVDNLLQNNKFGPLAGNNNNDNADQAGAGSVPAVPAPSKPTGQQRQPPLVVTNMIFNRLLDVMVYYKVKPEMKYTRSGIKLTCFSVEEFDKVKEILIKCQVQFYTHGRRSERSHRVVLRGLPEMDEEKLKDLLKENHSLDVLDVKAIKRNGEPTTGEVPYIVSFPRGHTNLKKLSTAKKMGPVIIRWEAYRNKQPVVTQCGNCLRLGHGAKNCYRKSRCNNCGKSHKTDQCKVEQTQAKRCANCSGAHEAMNRSCPKRAEFILSRQQSSKPKPPTRKADKASPAKPALTPADFPPLPGAVPGEEVKSPRPGGGSKRNTGSRAGGTTKEDGAAGSSQENTGPGAGATHKAEGEEELYSSAELWKIFVEFSARLKNSKTRSDQVAVLGYMICKYGSK